METNILQSLISRNKAKLSDLHETVWYWTVCIKSDRQSFTQGCYYAYDYPARIRNQYLKVGICNKEIKKLVAIQKSLKKQIKHEIEYARFVRDKEIREQYYKGFGYRGGMK